MYNRIMVNSVKYNWLDFYNVPDLKLPWWYLCLKEFWFVEAPTQSSTEKYSMRHWEYVNPTMLKNRHITLLFDILADNEADRWEWLKKVQRAFAPEQNPTPFNKYLWKSLTFLDRNLVAWTANCQTSKWVQLSDFGNEKRWTISVELITDNPYFHSVSEVSQSIYNTRWWVKLPTKLWFYWQYYDSGSLLDYRGIYQAPCSMEMNFTWNTFPNNNIQIIHRYNNIEQEIMYLDNVNSLWIQVWDKITIDCDNRRVLYFNSTNETTTDITSLVRLWSEWFLLRYWENYFTTNTGTSTQEMTTRISFYDLL